MADRAMTADDLKNIKPGTIIRHRDSSEGMVITANYGSHAIAARTTAVSNPSEWMIVELVDDRHGGQSRG